MPLYSAKSALPKAKRRVPRVALYSDNLTSGGDRTFSERQWFSSGANAGASNSILYGDGMVTLLTGASARHALCHFDCMREQYPAFDSTKTYSIGDIVYGGYYGHGLYRKTALASGAPIFGSATTAQDANGWTRYRPTIRTIQVGDGLNISLKLKLQSPGVFSTNGIRIGLFRSFGQYLNNDNHLAVNPLFSGYTGYMFGYGNQTRISERINPSSPALITTTTGIYGLLSSVAGSLVPGIDPATGYDISISLVRSASLAGLLIKNTTSIITGPTSRSTNTALYLDASGTNLSFDTIVVSAASNQVASLSVSNPIITYVGKSQPLPSCSDATAKVLMTGSNAVWPHGPRLLSPIGYLPYGFETYQYGDEVVRYDGSAWIYENNAGIGEIARVYSNQPRPWLATWPNFSAEKVCV